MRIGFVSLLSENLEIFRMPIMLKLKEAGHEVIAFLPQAQNSHTLEAAGIQVVHYRLDRRSLNPFALVTSTYSLFRQLQKSKLDIVQSFTHKPNILTAFAARAAGVEKIILSVTGLGSFYVAENFVSRVLRICIEMLYRIAIPVCSRVVFQNEADKEYFEKRRIIRSEKACVIKGSGIDPDDWPKHSETNPLTVLMVARIIVHKGVREFLDAAKLVHEEMPEVKFVFIGWKDPGNRFALPESIFDDYPMVEFLGKRSDVKQQLAGSAVFVLPSHREGISRSLMEAICSGKPVVACDVPGCRELIEDGRNGFLIPVAAPEKLAQILLELLKNSELRAEFGIHSREKAIREYHVDAIVEQYFDLYGIS